MRADPPSAVCGQVFGTKTSGSSFRAPDSLRKKLRSPVAISSVMLLSNTPPGGTLGRSLASDQSTVAQPDIGRFEMRHDKSEADSMRLSFSKLETYRKRPYIANQIKRRYLGKV